MTQFHNLGGYYIDRNNFDPIFWFNFGSNCEDNWLHYEWPVYVFKQCIWHTEYCVVYYSVHIHYLSSNDAVDL